MMSFLPTDAEKPTRLSALRAALSDLKADGFLIPRTDEYQNEYIPDHAQRLAWLTGFTGSAGLGIVLQEKAALFVDGRYTLQAPAQTDTNIITSIHSADQSPQDWLKSEGVEGFTLAYDPWLHTLKEHRAYEKTVTALNGTLVAVEQNPIDGLWSDQPTPPATNIIAHPVQYTGEESAQKRTKIADVLSAAKQDVALITDPASIAWLLNVRATDVPCTPLPLSTALITNTGQVTWFVDADRLAADVLGNIGDGVTVAPMVNLAALAQDYAKHTVRMSATLTPVALVNVFKAAGALIAEADDPCLLPRACKSSVEVKGSAQAHIRDGVAVTKFLHWFDTTLATGNSITEMQTEEVITNFRKEQDLYRDISFEPITGAGPNGAIVHYRVTPETNRTVDRDSLFLIDSGGQYADGTTDITRTIATGTVSAEMSHRYTEVLKGHIALSLQRFPEDTTGAHLDVLARAALWQSGMDYAHGTGHGVGSYLGVHEGPQRISGAGHQKLMPGMIISNEPGYYKTGAYGIRIENLVVVRADNKSTDAKQMLAFDTLTCAPIDTRPVRVDLLSEAERTWLNSYHAWVNLMITPHLTTNEAEWLAQATKAI